MKRYVAIIEKGPTNYGAYVPDLPGCVAVADSVEEVQTLTIELHVEAMLEDGDPIPEPTSTAVEIEVQAA